MWFGQLVIGPPGAGKSTYCHGMHQLLTALGRSHVTINMDPANDNLQFDYDIDIRELVDIETVMQEYQLGPNGALVFCMEYILENFDWLKTELEKFPNRYMIVDFPGQVELYTHHNMLQELVGKFLKIDCRVASVHLVDSTLCVDASKYLSALMVSLSAMIMLELPHVNLLSKVDMLKILQKDKKLDVPFELFVQAENLDVIIASCKQYYSHQPRLLKLLSVIGELVEEYNIVSFLPLDIHDKKSMILILKSIDTANGFGFASSTLKGDYEFGVQSIQLEREQVLEDVIEKYIASSDEEAEEEKRIEEIQE